MRTTKTTTKARGHHRAAVLATAPVAFMLLTGTAAFAQDTDLTVPQPLSNADKTGNGANPGTLDGCGAYCSTRDGSQGGNGVGGGNANGQPCAGCVGNADNKNPPGQAPGGSDGNAGYECDRNQGVGQGNPAHTGCTDPVVPPVGPPVLPPVVVPPVVVPPVVVPPVVTPPAGSGGAGSGGVVVDTPTPTVPTPTPETPAEPVDETPTVPVDQPTDEPTDEPVDSGQGDGEVVIDTPTDEPAEAPEAPVVPETLGEGTVTVDRPAVLPFTGDSTGILGLVALAMLGTGVSLTVAGRRTGRHTA